MVYEPQTLAGITALRWINIVGRNVCVWFFSVIATEWMLISFDKPILVTSNPGIIKLWSRSSDNPSITDGWTGYRSLLIKTQKISVDSSAFHRVTGISYLQNQDCLLITLFDGSFHVICDFGRDPRWASTSDIQNYPGEVDIGPLTSEDLSKMSRSLFIKAEKGNVDRRDMVRINGVAPYDDASCFAWVYEYVSLRRLLYDIGRNLLISFNRTSRPSDFSYKHDAKHSNMLMVAQMWEEHDDELFLHKLSVLLNTVKTSMMKVLLIMEAYLTI